MSQLALDQCPYNIVIDESLVALDVITLKIIFASRVQIEIKWSVSLLRQSLSYVSLTEFIRGVTQQRYTPAFYEFYEPPTPNKNNIHLVYQTATDTITFYIEYLNTITIPVCEQLLGALKYIADKYTA